MIEADAAKAIAALATRLRARARTLAEARAGWAWEDRRDDAPPWRKAQFVWPLFVKG
jgi:hypothetical protein